MPNAISKIHKLIPEKVEALYQRYPYDIYGELEMKKRLRINRIRERQIEYQECCDAGIIAYMYSIHRCALKDYQYVKAYIRKMISIAIIEGINIAREDKHLCDANGLQQIPLDSVQ